MDVQACRLDIRRSCQREGSLETKFRACPDREAKPADLFGIAKGDEEQGDTEEEEARGLDGDGQASCYSDLLIWTGMEAITARSSWRHSITRLPRQSSAARSLPSRHLRRGLILDDGRAAVRIASFPGRKRIAAPLLDLTAQVAKVYACCTH